MYKKKLKTFSILSNWEWKYSEREQDPAFLKLTWKIPAFEQKEMEKKAESMSLWDIYKKVKIMWELRAKRKEDNWIIEKWNMSESAIKEEIKYQCGLFMSCMPNNNEYDFAVYQLWRMLAVYTWLNWAYKYILDVLSEMEYWSKERDKDFIIKRTMKAKWQYYE